MDLNTNQRPEKVVTVTKQQRILFLQNSSVFEAFGGIEFYQDDILNIAASLYPPGSVASVIAQKNPDTVFDARDYKIFPVPFKRQGFARRVENRFSFALLMKAKEVAKTLNPTLIIAGHIGLAPLAMTLSKWTGVPYWVVGYGIEIWGSTYKHDEFALRQAQGIISISYWTKKVLLERKYHGSLIRIVHPHLPREFEKQPAPVPKEPKNGTVTLLTVSRLESAEQYKGQDHVLQALAMLKKSAPELKLRYIIQGDGSDRPRLEAMAKELGLSEMVEFRGRVKSRDELEAVYKESDLYVMPSRYGVWDKRWRGEGFGIVYLEAAAFGVPSIAYDCGGATDIISNGVNGRMVPPDNIPELAKTIRQLAENHELRAKLGKKAYEICMHDFTQQAVRKQMIAAFNAF